ncbi:leucyl aminopeptidase [Mesorhizobium xinjiangense]|uniref:leucyl aminopeptidase n=1 Tax=Mesorhizobium xinjiangense TaxID=2678685 RepID=UPI0012EE0945|nr:leucyl aminopeptidase [Mesorhizobium xinjiangense]
MGHSPSISFAKFTAPKTGNVIVLAADGGTISERGQAVDPAGVLKKAFGIAEFTGKAASTVEVLAPQDTGFDRLVAIGAGSPDKLDEQLWLRLGGVAYPLASSAPTGTVILDLPDDEIASEMAATFALGMALRAYSFDKYKTKKGKEDDKGASAKAKKDARIVIQCADPAAAKKEFAAREAALEGANLARELVNEPANMLGPLEFADRARELEKLGVEVEILAEKDMKKLGMGALLGVAQGSPRGARLVVMQWKGGKAKKKPVAFIGKGVTFDTGGNSMKPVAGMEDMKGDMGGAAAVTGLMHTLAKRKAKVNAVGIIGLVENSVDGASQRPGDIVTSMSGQTIEVINTDAEGRLVLCDALWYCNDRFKPKFMIDLATLTGAVIVALGQNHAGLFSNDDELAERLAAAGSATGEKLWRLPLGEEYDKLLDSKNADMKNVGGRQAGAITAAQFLQRFVKDAAWAHLDIAGTAMGSPATDTNKSWGSGFGVRLLDRLVSDHYEG